MIPNKYPDNIKEEEIKLTPLAVLDLYAFTTATGHDEPKHINIAASNISYNLFYLAMNFIFFLTLN